MADLFDHAMQERMQQEAPLAARMRPRSFDDFIGQEHIIGEGKILRRAIQADRLFSSIIFTGPPGTGKTTLAQLIALNTKAHFDTIQMSVLLYSDRTKYHVGHKMEYQSPAANINPQSIRQSFTGNQ